MGPDSGSFFSTSRRRYEASDVLKVAYLMDSQEKAEDFSAGAAHEAHFEEGQLCVILSKDWQGVP